MDNQVTEDTQAEASNENSSENEEQTAGNSNVEELKQASEDKTEEEPKEEFKEKFYYLAAEMENLKKRFQKEKENIVKYSHEKVMSDLIEVVDNFERVTSALKSDTDEKIKNIVVGIDMVKKQFLDSLAKSGLEQMDTVGKKFDPNFHEAIGEEEAEGKEEQEILSEFMKGYKLNGRVIRAAKVIVSKIKNS